MRRKPHQTDDPVKVRLMRLKSDLKDCRDPKVLVKYPHLGSPNLIESLEAQIAEIERTRA